MKTVDWNHIRAFHATALAGSLSAAARRLGLTQPTLSRQVLALEAGLGVTLFERRGRKLALTQIGADLLDHTRIMGDAADTVVLAASGRVQELGGRVSISATDTYAAYILPGIVERIRSEAPRITIVVIASNEFSNLHGGEADIAIRHARPDREGLVGHHVRDTEARFYASEAWAARVGHLEGPADLAGPALIGLSDKRFAGFLRDFGIPLADEDLRIRSDSAVAIWEMVKRGMGVAAMLREIAERTPGVVDVLPDMVPIQVPVWLVMHRELESSPRIRLVQTVLSDELARL